MSQLSWNRFKKIGVFLICIYFSFIQSAVADGHCPKMDDHSLSPIKYQLFTAYQTAYDGYHTPCDLKCFGKEQCTQSCQAEKGLISLSIELDRLKTKNNLNTCESYTSVCIDQCEELGESCKKACGA